MKWLVLAVLAVGLSAVVLFLTGHCRRAYATLRVSDSVTIQGQRLGIAELAHRYQPRVFMPVGSSSPAAIGMWYEVIDRDGHLPSNQVAIVYRCRWEGEVHPIPLVDWFYRAFRAVYYGYPTHDVEYIQVNVNRDDGGIEKIRFEMGPDGAYDRRLSEHLKATISRNSDKTYDRQLATGDGLVVASGESVQLGDGSQQAFGVQTWNHLLVLLSTSDHDRYPVPQPMALEYMTDEAYAANKSCRRGQGDFATAENQTRIALPLMIISLVTVAPLVVRIWQVLKARSHRRA